MKKKKINAIYIFIISIFLVACLLLTFILILKNKTTLSEEKHIQILLDKTEKIFEEEIKSGKVVNYSSHIMYSFNKNKPQYFLIELEFADYFDYLVPTCYSCFEANGKRDVWYSTKNKHIIGYIDDNEYKIKVNWRLFTGEMDGSYNLESVLINGQSPFSYLGYDDCRKYYGNNIFGIEKDENVVQIYKKGDALLAKNYPVGSMCKHREDNTETLLGKKTEKNFYLKKSFFDVEYDEKYVR